MESIRNSGFVGGDSLEFVQAPHVVTIEGEIQCLGEILITVFKTLEVLGGEGLGATVRTATYSYNVSVRNRYNIFRYDNLHPIKGFPDNHHKDLYEWRTGNRLPSKWIGERDWPTLADAIYEAQRWYYHHMHELEHPDRFPELGLRG